MRIGQHLFDMSHRVWVSHSRKVIYVKNARAASTSMLRKLRVKCPDLLRVSDTPQLEKWMSGVSDKVIRDYWIFTMVRNTWDRLVSAYSYLHEGGEIDCEFGEFIGLIESGILQEDICGLVEPQEECYLLEGRVFADYVGRFEHLGLACKRVKDRCGHWNGGLPVENSTKHRPFHEYYDKETAAAVFRIYKDDIETLGCKIQGFDVVPPMEWLKVEGVGI